MEQAADCWGRDHDKLLTQLCFHIAKHIFGEDCSTILQSLSSDINDIDQLQESSGLSPEKFQAAFRVLVRKKVIAEDKLEIDLFSIFNTVLYPHFIQYAESFAPIPQDKQYISIITKKVLDESTLSSERLIPLLCTKYPELSSEKLKSVINVLIKKSVLTESEENGAISFNFALFLASQRESALESLVELNDRRVLEVVRALFSRELYQRCLETNEPQAFDQETVIPVIAAKTELSRREISSIFDILRTPEYSIISSSEDVLTPANGMKSFKMKRVGHLLSEIGYPLSRRVINLLQRKESLEFRSLCEHILMSPEDAQSLLEKMKYLGILESEELQDAPHTKLKRQYVIWRLSYDTSINNASSYLLGVLAKLYYDLQNEQQNLELDASFKKQNAGERLRRFNEKTKILQNTMLAVTKRYIEIHEL